VTWAFCAPLATSADSCKTSRAPGKIYLVSMAPPLLLSLCPQEVRQQLTDLKAQVDRMEELLRRALADRAREQ
jgi:hypothetical protein